MRTDDAHTPKLSERGNPQREEAARAIVAALRQRWELGEATDDDEVLAAHADLLPELARALEDARMIRSAITAGRRLGPAEQAIPFRVLSDDELDAPIETSEEPADDMNSGGERHASGPKVPGVSLQEQIGAGGQAAVYRGFVDSTGRAVAVKVIPRGSTADARHRRRVEREVEILAALRHPHVIDIIDRGRTADGDFYLVMPFVEGRDLDQWWSACVPDGEAGTRILLQQFVRICRAVNAAHAAGIVHRDLKPSNVRVDSHGEPSVLDFGLARPIATSRAVTVAGQLLGSVPWASPEQVDGNSGAVDARSDVYAIGVMLYQALTGDFPYPVDGPLHETLSHIARTRILPPSARCGRHGSRDRALDAIVLKALAKHPSDRYECAGALADDLDRSLTGKSVLAPSIRSSRRLRIAALSFAAILVAGGAAITWQQFTRVTPPVQVELPTFTNSIGMRFVQAPGGTFWMGSRPTESGRDENEVAREVALNEFSIGVAEVTQRQYRQVMGGPAPGQSVVDPELPVHSITWDQAVAFCEQLSALDGRQYRLPTEAEWEYACRAGSNTPFPPGGTLDDVGWFLGNSDRTMHPAGLKWPNRWGLLDVHGNAAEWCAEDFRTASTDAATRAGAQARPTRGGSFLSAPAQCRAAARALRDHEFAAPDLGFRVVCTTAPPSTRAFTPSH